MKKILFLGCFCLMSWIHPEYIEDPPNIPNFVVWSMPKAGSDLLFKAIHRMTGLKPEHIDETEDLLYYERPENTYPWKLLSIPNDVLKKALKNKSQKKIVLIRDLRDITVSHILHLEHHLPETWLHDFDEPLYQKQPLDKKLIFFMVQNPYYLSSPKRITKQVLQCSTLSHTHIYKDVLICRFENLIGPQGGGTSLLQRKELEKIAQFLNISLTPCEIEKIAETLFGIDELLDYKWKKNYYKSGRIGGWKRFFTADVLESYDDNLKSLNTKLGYK